MQGKAQLYWKFRKRVWPRLFGVRLAPDVVERWTRAGLPMPLTPRLRTKVARFIDKELIFIHTPKSGGTAISDALFGLQVKHTSIRAYQALLPRLVDRCETFTVIRDPVDRFVSAYRFATSGGTADKRVSRAFRRRYAAFETLADAIDHVRDAPSVYELDQVFRPQVWYLNNANGDIAVDTIVRYEDIDLLTDRYTDAFDVPIERINVTRSSRKVMPSDEEAAAIRALYAQDVALYRSLGSVGKDGAAEHC